MIFPAINRCPRRAAVRAGLPLKARTYTGRPLVVYKCAFLRNESFYKIYGERNQGNKKEHLPSTTLNAPIFLSAVFMYSRNARRSSFGICLPIKEKKRADLKGRNILMAEDVLINAEIMKQIILMREAEIDHAENGKKVLELFENSSIGHYDAILMDVRMPEMDGLEAATAIRALGRPDAKTIPIIALTANAFDEDVQRSLQVGMDAHLSKPVDPERLYQTLEELIWEYDTKKQADQ